MIARQKSSQKKRVCLKCGFFLYLGICLFALVWLRSAVVSLEYEIGDLDKMGAGLMREQKMAVAKRANHFSTSKIEKVALKRLGMALPDRENVFFVRRELAAAPYKASMK